jgi:hypothetical protein
MQGLFLQMGENVKGGVTVLAEWHNGCANSNQEVKELTG